MRRTLIALFSIIILMTTSTSFAGVCGDVNNSGTVNIQDITHLINFLYKGGPAPFCALGDVNNSGTVNIQDITCLINFLYKGGPDLDCGPTTGTITDIDGNVYQTIKVCNQWWMAENLEVTHYRNGDAIPNVMDNTEWADLTTGAFCEYDNDVDYVATYGRLYNWYAVNDSRNIAPAGWHVPSEVEWQTLVDYLGGDAVAGGKMKEAGTSHWASPNTGATNESGFSALPAGYRMNAGYYLGWCNYTFFWSSTEFIDNTLAYAPALYYNDARLGRGVEWKEMGLSIRCVKD